MSVYPRFNTSSNTFNSQDIISYEEQSSGQTVVSLDLSSFVSKSAPVFENELYLKENVGINMNGARQLTAFTDEYKSDLENNKSKLTAIDYSNNKTVVSQNLDLTGATVSLNDDQIGQEKITGLVTRLTEIDTNLFNINSNDNDIANLNTTTATHTAQLTAIESKNDTQDGRLDTTETDVENITIRITDAETDISNLESKDTQHDASLNELFGLTTTLTNDVVSLNTMDIDISNNLNTYKVSNDASIASLNNDIIDIQTLNVSQNSRLDAVETLNTTQDGRLDAIETLNTTQDGRLDAVESKNVIQDTSINLLETLTASHTTDLTNLTSIQNANIANITTLQGENTTQASQISTLEGQIVTKHPTINNANKLNATYVGNGDVSNAKLSALNDVRTDVSIQNQINTINDSITGLDALQDLDLINIPILQTDVANLVAKDVTVDVSLNALATDIATNASAIASNTASINTTNTNVNNNANSISTLNTNVASLVSADGIHNTQISDLQNADTVLQANIDFKEDIISLANKLDTTKIFDTGLNDSLNAILSTVDSNITLLNSSKQDNITTLNKLNTSLLNRDDNLLFCDATSSIQGQINAINSNISLLQGVDTTIISDIQANFDTHDASITANTNAISTLQGLQDGDVVSFNSINSSITNLTNTKHPLIDTNNKLNSSLLNRDDNLQHIDITSSLQGKLNSLDTDIASKQNVIDNSNKLDATLLNLNNNLQYADYGSSVTTKFASVDSSISSLNANDVSQATTNTNLQNSINSNASDITDLQNNKQNLIDTNNKLSISNVDLTGSDLANMDYSTGSLTTKLNTLQSNIDNIDLSSKQDVIDTNNKLSISNVDLGSSALSYVDITSGLQSSLNTLQSNIDNINTGGGSSSSSKIENVEDTMSYNTSTNVLTHTYNEENLFVNQLDDNNVFELDLTISSPINYKTYNQKLIIDCLQFKGYVNTLKINGTQVEIKHRDGNSNINLSPLLGYSLIEQYLTMTRYNDKWYVQSNLDLFYNSNSNAVYDTVAPVLDLIKVNGSDTIIHDLGTVFTDPGYTAIDNIDGDITGNVIVSGSVDVNTAGIYTITYTVNDANNNQSQTTREVRVKEIRDTMKVRYIKIKNNHPNYGYVVVPQVEIYDHNNVNIALNKPTTASSTMIVSGVQCVPSFINNGLLSGRGWGSSPNAGGVFAHTLKWTSGPAEYIQIDLQEETYIKEIKIYQRSDWTLYINPYFTMDLLDDGNNVLETHSLNETGDITRGNYDPPFYVLTLTGDGVINHPQLSTFNDPGAVGIDEYGVNLSISVGGDAVDINTIGTYNILYSCVDTDGNSHQVSRTVNVIDPFTLAFTNSSTDILQYANFESKCNTFPKQTKYAFTLSGETNSYLDGDYTFETSSYSSEADNRTLIRPNDTLVGSGYTILYENCYLNKSYHDTTLATSVTYTSQPYDNTTKLYTGNTSSSGNINHQQLCNNTMTYGGEWIECTFPFHIVFSRVYLSGKLKDYFAKEVVFLAKKSDDTYDHIFTKDNNSSSIEFIDCSISTTNKYKGLKIIFTKCSAKANRPTCLLDTLQVYGDIYTII